MISAEERVLTYLPASIANSVKRSMSLYKGSIAEIRLRAGRPVFLTANCRNINCSIISTDEDIQKTVRNLCGNSLYSHSETIKDGYICVEGGIRVGVCGRAVTDKGMIISVTDISSLCIRIPHRVDGVADPLIRIMLDMNRGMLLFSRPGVGKTTVLRELAARMAAPPFNLRVAVIDTRFEICGALYGSYTIDALSGYPRAKGIETALRTLSPQMIICDEIASADDAKAIMDSAGAGVTVVASAHAGSREELFENENIARLLKANVFSATAQLTRNGAKMSITVTDNRGITDLC